MNITPAEQEILRLVNSGIFDVDDSGRIWRIFRHHTKLPGVVILLDTPKRAEYKHDAGYLYLQPRIDNHSRKVFAHRIVYMVKVGEIPDGYSIDHVNFNRSDNRPENLEAVTQSENMIRAAKAGHLKSPGNIRIARSVFDRVVQLVQSNLLTSPEIARALNVRVSYVHRVRYGRTKRLDGN
jgi:hypothetical protein